MTQPKFAPIESADEVRPSYELATPGAWFAHRPAEFRARRRVDRKGFGTPGPDQGYALRLASLFKDQLVLSEGEYADDAMCAAVTVALRRAAQFGRAPVRTDIECGLLVFGYLGDAPKDLVQYRHKLLGGIAHDYLAQRTVVSLVTSEALALSPAALRDKSANWQSFFYDTSSN